MTLASSVAETVEKNKPASVDKRPKISSERKEIENSKSIVKDVVSKEPFVNVQEEKVWNFEEDDVDDEGVNPDIKWLSDIVSFISMIIEAALWLIPVLVVFYLYRYRRVWLNLIQKNTLKKSERELPETLFGLDVRKESLPDNIEKAAQQLWLEKQYREAVSLLYRGALIALFKKYRFELPPGATEQDCIRQLQLNNQNSSIIEERIDRFEKLTDVWISVAYAHRFPDDVVFTQICDEWNQCFSDDEGD